MEYPALFWASALKATFIFGTAWLLTALPFRRSSAAARHLVWTAAFAAVLALPLLSVLLPAVPLHGVAPLLDPLATFEATALAWSGGVSVGHVAPPVSSGTPLGTVNWLRWILLLWSAGTAVSLAQMSLAWLGLERVRRRATPLPTLNPEVFCDALGIRRRVDVLQTRRGSMPMAFGLFHPAVFLPADAAGWTAERRRVVLLHELAHVRRSDLPLHLMARLGLAIYWWNPFAWLAWREFLKERERATDDLVLHAGARASDYAGHLLEIARAMQAAPALGSSALAMARRSQLEGRLLAILDSGANRSAPRRVSVATAILLAVAVIAPFAAIRAQDRTATLPADVDVTIRTAAAEKNHEMLENAAKAAEVLQQYDLARRLLDSSLEIRAEASGAQGVAYGIGLIKIGDLERSRNNFDEAQAFYEKAVSVLGNRPEASPALVHLGILASRTTKNLDTAFDYFQRAQAADPAHAGMAVTWMAVVRERQKNMEGADALYKQALSLDEVGSADAALTMELYAALLQRQKQEDEAKAMRDQAASLRKELGTRELAVSRGSEVKAFRVGAGTLPPRLSQKVEPAYSEEARLARYQGTVVVSVVIGTDGIAQNMRVIRGLGLGLNEQAMKAIGQWQFQPGSKDGEPVPVQATIEVNFRLL